MNEAELKKLKALLAHWIEHSEEHGAEFEEWAEKAKAAGYAEVYNYMITASKEMGSVKSSLVSALAEIDKKAK